MVLTGDGGSGEVHGEMAPGARDSKQTTHGGTEEEEKHRIGDQTGTAEQGGREPGGENVERQNIRLQSERAGRRWLSHHVANPPPRSAPEVMLCRRQSSPGCHVVSSCLFFVVVPVEWSVSRGGLPVCLLLPFFQLFFSLSRSLSSFFVPFLFLLISFSFVLYPG